MRVQKDSIVSVEMRLHIHKTVPMAHTTNSLDLNMYANVRHAQKDTIVNHLVNKLPQINVHLDSTARQGLVLSMQTHALWGTTEMPLRQ